MITLLSTLVVGCSGKEPDTDPADGCVDAGSICTVAGTGIAGLGAEGVDALDSHLYLPQDLTFGPDGLPYILDWNNHRIRRIGDDGTIQTIAGTGMLGDGPEGPMMTATFNHPTNIAFDSSGDLLLAAWHNSRVERLDLATGSLSFECGTGGRGYNGDEIDAKTAILDLPSGIVLDAQGRAWISDQANQLIRMVENGIIYDVAGGQRVIGYGGDGGPAESAIFHASVGQAADPALRIALSGSTLYIADTGNHMIRTLDIDTRMVSAFAGTAPVCDEAGTVCSSDNFGTGGDAGPALSAELYGPTDVAVGPGDEVYIADTSNHCVRVVGTDGVIDTFAGTCGVPGFDGDGGPANEALLQRPYGVTVDPDGMVWIADSLNHVLRRVQN